MGFEFAPFVDVYFNFTSDDWNSDLNKSKIEKKYFYEEYFLDSKKISTYFPILLITIIFI